MGGNAFKDKTWTQTVPICPFDDITRFYDSLTDLQFQFVSECDLVGDTPTIEKFANWLIIKDKTNL